MFGSSEGSGRGSILVGTIKGVAVIGIMSYLAAGWISASADRQALARLANAASRADLDPLTTGSVGARTGAARLDPCSAPRR